MKQKPLTPFPGSSKPSSRKSRALVLLVLLSATSRLWAQEIETSVLAQEGRVFIEARLSGVARERILSSLHEGLVSQVAFQFRYYRRPGGAFWPFGDRLVRQAEMVHSGSMDFFDGRYILESELRLTSAGTRDRNDHPGDSTVLSFSTPGEFMRHFLSVPSFVLETPNEGTRAERYVMARARLDYVRLDAPLNIITLFRTTAATTEWHRVDIVQE